MGSVCSRTCHSPSHSPALRCRESCAPPPRDRPPLPLGITLPSGLRLFQWFPGASGRNFNLVLLSQLYLSLHWPLFPPWSPRVLFHPQPPCLPYPTRVVLPDSQYPSYTVVPPNPPPRDDWGDIGLCLETSSAVTVKNRVALLTAHWTPSRAENCLSHRITG